MSIQLKEKLKSSAGVIGVAAMMIAGIGAASALSAIDDDKKKAKEEIIIKKMKGDKNKDVHVNVEVIADDKNTKKKVIFWSSGKKGSDYEIIIDKDGNERRIDGRHGHRGHYSYSYKLNDKERKEAEVKIKTKLEKIESKLKVLEKKNKKDSLEYSALEMARDVLKETLNKKTYFIRTSMPHKNVYTKEMNTMIMERVKEAMDQVKGKKEEIIIMRKHMDKELKGSMKEMEKAFEKMHKEFEKKDLSGDLAKSLERNLLRAEKEKLKALQRAEKHIEREVKRLERKLKDLEKREKELNKKSKVSKDKKA